MKHTSRTFQLFLIFLLALLTLKGCKVPDIKPFVSATNEMTSALTAGFDQVLTDLEANTKLELSYTRAQTVKGQRDRFASASDAVKKQLAAFDKYAATLSELAESGDKGKETINKLADAVKNVSAVFPVAAPVGTVLGDAAKAIADNLVKILTLKKLENAVVPADIAIQNAAIILHYNLKDLIKVDSAAGQILNTQISKQNNVVISSYDGLLARQRQAEQVAGLLVQFENTAVDFKAASGERQQKIGSALVDLHSDLVKLDATLNIPSGLKPSDPANMKTALGLVTGREPFWRGRVDNGISPQMQARYDRVQATLAANETNTAQHLSVLRKSQSLVKAWASGHQSMRKAVTDQRRSVSFPEVMEQAEKLKDFIDTLQKSNTN